MNNDVKVKDLKRVYDGSFVPSQEYLDSMPDLQNANFVGIPIDFVGIQGMHLPLKIREQNGDVQEVMVNVTGTVSLDAFNRGVNLSRILRTLYKSKDDIFAMENGKYKYSAAERDQLIADNIELFQ